MRILLLLLGLFTLSARAAEPLPTSFHAERYDRFESRFVESRIVDVWLPEGITKADARHYGVIYMQDGQNLFDPATGYGHQTWGVDQVVNGLIAAHKIGPVIIVGIWNSGAGRARDYMPQAAFAALPPELQRQVAQSIGGPPVADNYLKFLVEEVKPFIDSHYPTLPDRDHTAIMGSSMGGLISLYAICRYPEIFGAAAGLSTHWPVSTDRDWIMAHGGTDNPLAGAFIDYLRDHLPDPQNHRIYYDHGSQGLDQYYAPYREKMEPIMRERHYHAPENWQALVFPGGDHNEASWHERLSIPLEFILR